MLATLLMLQKSKGVLRVQLLKSNVSSGYYMECCYEKYRISSETSFRLSSDPYLGKMKRCIFGTMNYFVEFI